MLRETVSELCRKLKPVTFVRVHRSVIVNLHYVRFVIAIHSPDRVAETGLPRLPSEKKASRPVGRVARTLSPVRFARKIRAITHQFQRFPKNCGLVSLHCRLCGGEGVIRTLGTGLTPRD
jgi:LytTr DNA-binding domain